MNSAGTSSWEESEKENYYAPAAPKVELEALVTFLSKFDSKIAAIWGGEGGGETNDNHHHHQAVWGEPAAPETEEDLLTSCKTHFKPIREREEPCFGFWSVEDPAEYATFKESANSTFPIRFKVKSVNDKGVQTDVAAGSAGAIPAFNWDNINSAKSEEEEEEEEEDEDEGFGNGIGGGTLIFDNMATMEMD